MMLNADFDGRQTFLSSTSVGSSSREGRLHTLLHQSLCSRRVFSSDTLLPRLSRGSNHPVTNAKRASNLTAVVEDAKSSRCPRRKAVRRAALTLRQSSTGETLQGSSTSSSCPGIVASYLENGLRDGYSAGMDAKVNKRIPATSKPAMTRRRQVQQRTVTVTTSPNTTNIFRPTNHRTLDISDHIQPTRRRSTMIRAGRSGSKVDVVNSTADEEMGSGPDLVPELGEASSGKPRGSWRHPETSAGKRRSTHGVLNLPPPSVIPRPSRRATVPVNSNEWYVPRFLRKGQIRQHPDSSRGWIDPGEGGSIRDVIVYIPAHERLDHSIVLTSNTGAVLMCKDSTKALALFRRSVRKVALVLSWFKSLSKRRNSMDQTLKSFLDMAKELEEDTSMADIEERSGGLTFDPRQYCAKKEVNLSEEQRTILTTPSQGRTPEMIQKVLSVLQNLKAFGEYPLHMQQKFAKVAWFQEVPPKRIILKQGHTAENFYFILAGKAIVKLITKDAKTGDICMRAVGWMKNGQSFGELALLQQSVRSATVESVTPMHILVITREDFQRIFFNTFDGQDPEHITFCKNQISFLQDFPLDLSMTKASGTCLFHFFRPGAVVVADSKKSDWIYIVRSGSCQVLKRLDAVNPDRRWAKRKMDLRTKIPRNGTAEPVPRVNTGLRDKDGSPHRAMSDRSDDNLSSYDSEDFEKYEENPEDDPVEPHMEHTRMTRFQLPERPVTCRDLPDSSIMPTIREELEKLGDAKKRKTPPKSAHTPTKSPRINAKVDGDQVVGDVLLKPGYSRSKLCFLPEIKKAYIMPVMPPSWADLDDDDDAGFTLAEAMTIDARSTRSCHPAKSPNNPKPPCFVQLRILRPSDCFGLEMIKFDDDQTYDATSNTSVALVSNGCELIMLSRRFFERHATILSKQHIREKVRPFPPEDTLQHNLQIAVNWDLFRKDIVGDFLDFVRQSHDLVTPATR